MKLSISSEERTNNEVSVSTIKPKVSVVFKKVICEQINYMSPGLIRPTYPK